MGWADYVVLCLLVSWVVYSITDVGTQVIRLRLEIEKAREEFKDMNHRRLGD